MAHHSSRFRLTMIRPRWQTPIAMTGRSRWTRKRDGFIVLLMAAALTVGLWFLPYGEVMVYPFRLFVTLIHETAHAVGAVMTGGRVDHIEITPDGSGVTYTRGGWTILIASAGYVGAILYGGLMLLLCRQARYAKLALLGTLVLVTLVTVLFVRPLFSFGFLASALTAVALAAALYFFTRRVIHFLVGFLAVESCLNALFDVKTVFLLSAETDVPTDAMTLERITHIPAIVWALGWVIASLAILAVVLRGFRSAFR